MLPSSLFNLLRVATTIYALPAKRTSNPALSASAIMRIDPKTATCDNAPAADECRTAVQAAPYIVVSFTNFGITSFGEQAALLSLMLYETGSFKYSTNHFPGVPGQGTRNMQSPAFNLEYATWLSTVCTNCGITPTAVQEAMNESPAAVLDLVNGDEWGFGSAAWFLATQCDVSVRTGLAAGTQEGWAAYLQCAGAAQSAERDQVWNAAMALGQS